MPNEERQTKVSTLLQTKVSHQVGSISVALVTYSLHFPLIRQYHKQTTSEISKKKEKEKRKTKDKEQQQTRISKQKEKQENRTTVTTANTQI